MLPVGSGPLTTHSLLAGLPRGDAVELYDGSNADAPLIASVTGDITDLSTADTFTSTGAPLRYRCHLGRILLKTAAISLLTGRNLFVRFVTDGGNCERAALAQYSSPGILLTQQTTCLHRRTHGHDGRPWVLCRVADS